MKLQRRINNLQPIISLNYPQFYAFYHGPDLMVSYHEKGDYNKAEITYTKLLNTNQQVLEKDFYFIDSLAKLYVSKGDYQKAESFYLQALDIRKKVLGENDPNTIFFLGILARLYIVKMEYDKVEQLCLQALDITEKRMRNHPSIAFLLETLASLYEKKEHLQKAESFYLQALDTRKKALGENFHDISYSFSNTSLFYFRNKNYEQAIKYNSEANEFREKDLSKNLILGSERQKQIYLQQYAYETDYTISLHTQSAPQNKTALESAIVQVLRRKGRSIDVVNQSIEALRKRSNPEDVALLDSLTDKKTQLSNLIIQGLGKRTPEEYQKQLKTLQDEIDQLEYKISEHSLEFRTQVQPITLKSVQQAIPQDVTLVEFASYRPYGAKTYTDGTPRYVAYLLNNQGDPQWAELGEAAIIDNLVDKLRTKLRSEKTNIEKEIKPLARKLDELVMRPVRKLTGKGKRLLIAPDGKLNLIPFAALVDEKGRFLVENYPISYLTSGRDLLRLQIKIDSKQSPVVIGDPDFGTVPDTANIKETSSIFGTKPFSRLKATEVEAKAIKEILPESQLLLHEQATEDALNNLTAPSILHIATHGFFLKEEPTPEPTPEPTRTLQIIGIEGLGKRPLPNIKIENPLLRSGIVLAGANLHLEGKDTGIVTALKTTALNLWGTKVVVLSACDTGVGEVKTGDGIYGLRRALVLAGSETQVMSLWPVSDQGTKDLMVNYYQRLEKGEGRADALRQVQLQFLKDPKHRHPFYWASFIQSGEWANLDGKR